MNIKHKIKLWIILGIEFAAIAVILVMIFFAGKKSYTVTFDLNGGTLISGDVTQRITQGHSATPPQTAKEGHYLLGWSGSYNEVTSDVTVKAVWEYETSHGITYETYGDSNYCIISGCYPHLVGELYIGAYHNGKKVLGIKSGAFKNCDGITEIHLLDGILVIEDEAFAGCSNLTTLDIPSTVISIGSNAFLGCEKLESIELPSTLESLGDRAFFACTSLTEVTLPKSLEAMGEYVFASPGLTVYASCTEEQIPDGWNDNWAAEETTVIYEESSSEAEDSMGGLLNQ